MRYKHISVYPKNGEEETWKDYAQTSNLSDFIREAVNTYVAGIEPKAPETIEDIEEVNRLKEENKQLREENERLKQQLALAKPQEADAVKYWNTLWDHIPVDNFKPLEDILVDAGIIKSYMSREERMIQEQGALDMIMNSIQEADYVRKAKTRGSKTEAGKKEGESLPLVYKEGRGWKRTK